MKSIIMLSAAIIITILFNSVLFGQQDTTFIVDNNGNIGIGTAKPNVGNNPLSRQVVTILGKSDGSMIEMGSMNPVNGIGIGRLNFYNGSIPVASIQVDSKSNTNNTGDIQFFTKGVSDNQIQLRTIITSQGNVGIGIGSAESRLTIKGNSTQPVIRLYSPNDVTGPGNYQIMVKNLKNGINDWYIGQNTDGSLRLATQFGFGAEDRFTISNDGKIGIGITNPSYYLHIGNGAYVSNGGVWTNASSKELKENIRDITEKEALNTLSLLHPKKFNYIADRDEECLGFIAEEVPAMVATNDRKSLSPMDIIAVLTKVVQQQQKKIEKLEERLESRK